MTIVIPIYIHHSKAVRYNGSRITFTSSRKQSLVPANQVKVSELRLLKAFDDLVDDHLATISAYMVRRSYAPGQFIFFEGAETTGLWFILEGKVKIIKQSTNGRLQGLCLVNRGKCFGSCPLFDADTNPADAQALNDVTLAILPRDAVQQLIYVDVDVATCLLKVYGERTGLLAHLGESLGTWPVGMRINDCLLAHAKQADQGTVVALTHEEIATLVGTAREVVTRHLAELEDAELISTKPGRIFVYNRPALQSPCTGRDMVTARSL